MSHIFSGNQGRAAVSADMPYIEIEGVPVGVVVGGCGPALFFFSEKLS